MINQYQAGLQPATISSAASGRNEISGYGSAEQGENIQQGYVALSLLMAITDSTDILKRI